MQTISYDKQNSFVNEGNNVNLSKNEFGLYIHRTKKILMKTNKQLNR